MATICVIRQSYFPLDTRVRREVDALLAAGHEIDVICLQGRQEPRWERRGPLTIWRIPLTRRRATVFRYVLEYAIFFLCALALASLLQLRRRYELIQVNSIPDFLVFAALPSRLLGARILLDLHECMPEFFATKFKASPHHPLVQLLARLEQLSIAFADCSITCTNEMRDAFLSRGTRKPIGVVFNGSDEAIFDPDFSRTVRRMDGSFRLISHGAVEERYGLDTLVRAVAILKQDVPGLSIDIYGDGSYLKDLKRLTSELEVADRVRFSSGFVPLNELVRAIADADAGVVAMKADAFRDLTLCNKMYDFIAMRKPTIVSRTRSVEAYFDDSCFQKFLSGDEQDLARAIRELYDDPDLDDQLAIRALQAAEEHRWPHQRQRYLDYVDRVLGTPSQKHKRLRRLPANALRLRSKRG
jgi:glycosyltransferase involved in cell wall biosynthesis